VSGGLRRHRSTSSKACEQGVDGLQPRATQRAAMIPAMISRGRKVAVSHAQRVQLLRHPVRVREAHRVERLLSPQVADPGSLLARRLVHAACLHLAAVPALRLPGRSRRVRRGRRVHVRASVPRLSGPWTGARHCSSQRQRPGEAMRAGIGRHPDRLDGGCQTVISASVANHWSRFPRRGSLVSRRSPACEPRSGHRHRPRP